MAMSEKTAPMARTNTARSEQTRSRILAAAAALFAERGYDAAGVAGICAAARVSKGCFYHHFPTKQAVFLHLLEDWLRGLDFGFQEALAAAPSVVDGLIEMAGRTRSIFEARGDRPSTFLEFWAQARKDPEIWRRTVAPLRDYRERFRAIIARGIAEGSLAPVEAGAASRVLVSLALGTVLQSIFEAGSEAEAPVDGRGWEHGMQEAVRLLIGGIGRRET